MILMASSYMGIMFTRAGLMERFLFAVGVLLLWMSVDNVWLNVLAFALAGGVAYGNFKKHRGSPVKVD